MRISLAYVHILAEIRSFASVGLLAWQSHEAVRVRKSLLPAALVHTSQSAPLVHQPRHCEERSDEAIQQSSCVIADVHMLSGFCTHAVGRRAWFKTAR